MLCCKLPKLFFSPYKSYLVKARKATTIDLSRNRDTKENTEGRGASKLGFTDTYPALIKKKRRWGDGGRQVWEGGSGGNHKLNNDNKPGSLYSECGKYQLHQHHRLFFFFRSFSQVSATGCCCCCCCAAAFFPSSYVHPLPTGLSVFRHLHHPVIIFTCCTPGRRGRRSCWWRRGRGRRLRRVRRVRRRSRRGPSA